MKIQFALILSLLCGSVFSQSTGINTTSPNSKAALDVSSIGNQGVLIPRLANAAKTALSPVASDQGLMFYNTTLNTISYWNGSTWLEYLNTSNSGSAWNLTGNTLTTSSFIGSVNAQDVLFRVNGIKRLKVLQNGNLYLYGANNNTIVGDSAGANTTSGYNTMIGYHAGLANVTSTYNTFIGYETGLKENSTSGGNTYVGNQAGFNSVNGYLNTFIGNSAGYSTTTGDLNTFLGTNAGYNNTTGSSNTFLGQNADVTIGTLTNATAVGYNAKVAASNSLILGGTGIYAVNVGIGTTTPNATLQVARGTGSAGTAAFYGTTNISHFNYDVAEDTYLRGGKANSGVYINDVSTGNVLLATGGGNVGIGGPNPPLSKLTINAEGAGGATQTGHLLLTSTNTWGTSLNIQNTSAGGSTYSLVSTGADHPMGDGSLVLQDIFTNYAFVLNSSTYDTHIGSTTTTGACVGIGYTNPAADLTGHKLQVNGAVLATGFFTSSDLRYKTQIRDIPNALESIRKLRGVLYYWRRKEYEEKEFGADEQVGVIAQELEKMYPQIVTKNDLGYRSVDYPKLSPILLQALKEMDSIITVQDSVIKSIRKDNLYIHGELNRIKRTIFESSPDTAMVKY